MRVWELLVGHAQIMGVITLGSIMLLTAVDFSGTLAQKWRLARLQTTRRAARFTHSAGAARTAPLRSFAQVLSGASGSR